MILVCLKAKNYDFSISEDLTKKKKNSISEKLFIAGSNLLTKKFTEVTKKNRCYISNLFIWIA